MTIHLPALTDHDIDEDVRAVSAFRGYADLLKSVREFGYVPTLRLIGECEDFDAAVQRVRDRMTSDGHAVYPAA